MRTKDSRTVEVVCTYCGARFKRYLSQTINPKTGQLRKVVKCDDCRRAPPEILFWKKVDKTSSPNGCWLWTACKHPEGYGLFICPTLREQRAHRVAWTLTNGPIPAKMKVLHKCPNKHNPACVNPAHLYLGTQSDNMNDAIAQGTFVHPAGETHYNALVNEQAVRDIRANYRRGNVKNLAVKYNVSVATVRDIAKRRSWKHVL